MARLDSGAPASVPITVVIAAYNAERFIGRTLKMLEAQTATASEIIVVDDGSTDDTASIAERTSARVIRATHAGLAASRNLGITAASNDWIALLDADDLWDPRKLENQWDVHLANPDLSLIATDFDEIDPLGSVLRKDSLQNLRQYRYIAAQQLAPAGSLLSRELLASSLPEWGLFLPSSVLMSRDLFARIGGFNVRVLSEDSEFFLRCIAHGSTAIIERSLVGYMRHPSQITATWSSDHVSLDLCRHIMADPASYHPRSVAAFKKRLPVLLLRHARLEMKQRNYRRAISEACSAVVSVFEPSAFGTLVLRLITKSPRMGSVLKVFRGVREHLAMIPGRKADSEGTGLSTQWQSLLANADRDFAASVQ